MRATYILDEADAQGPWVLLCERCITALNHEVTDWDWVDADENWRCACCGATATDFEFTTNEQ